MTDFDLGSHESDEERLERMERELEDRERAELAATVSNVAASSKTSARALFALGLIAGVAGSSILWYERRVDAYLSDIEPELYRTVSLDVPTNRAELLLYIVDEAVEAYEALVGSIDDGEKVNEERAELARCASSARDALATPDDAQTLVAPMRECEALLAEIEPKPTEAHVAIAALATLSSFDSAWLDELLVATWRSGSYMPAHAGLAGVRALGTALALRDPAPARRMIERCAEVSAAERVGCRFEAALALARNVASQDGVLLDFSIPLGDGAAPYRYAFAVAAVHAAGAYNMPSWILSMRMNDEQESVEMSVTPVARIERGQSPVSASVTTSELWNVEFREGELFELGARPAGWWPCYEEIGYGFFPNEGAWIERYRSVPEACVGVSIEDPNIDGQALADAVEAGTMTVTVATQAEIDAARAAVTASN